MASQIPPFRSTPASDIPSIVSRLRAAFLSHKTRPVEYRLKQLRKLYWAVEDHKEELQNALRIDLGKNDFECVSSEIMWVQNDIVFVTKHLKKWCKDETPEDADLLALMNRARVRKDPLGVILVIGAFNFPIQLAFGPMIGAIAAGNTVALKPSENAPNCAMVMQKVMAASLDPDCYQCIQGSVPETQALLSEKWDKICFTGSPRTGQIVAEAAAKKLTPVLLELGGRNAAIVTRNANIPNAAKRLLWGKTMNSGQVCMAHNYTIVDESVLDQFVSETKKQMSKMFPNGAQNSPDYAKIIDRRSFNRIKKMLDSTQGRIVLGGTMDAEKCFIEPTMVIVTDQNDSLLVDESFGPLLPIIAVKNLDEAISLANSIDSTPLGVYPFGSKAETAKVLAEIRSGGATENDAFVHGCAPTLEFGGVGGSGHGNYRGKASFDAFVNRRGIMTVPNWVEPLLNFRYFPQQGTNKLRDYQLMSKLRPNFDRQGNEKTNILWFLLTLGAKSASGGIFRLTVLAGIALMLKFVMDRRIAGALR